MYKEAHRRTNFLVTAVAVGLAAGTMIGVHGMIGKWEPKKRTSTSTRRKRS